MIFPHKVGSINQITRKIIKKHYLPEDPSVELTGEVLQTYLEHCQVLRHHTIEILQS